MTIQTLLNEFKTIFAVDMPEKFSGITGVLFAAPRPILGKEHYLGVCLHGRFYAEVDPSEYCAEAFIKKNMDLDARAVLSASSIELLEVVYQDNKNADRYREFPLEDQLDMLSHKINGLRDLPYSEAVTRLAAARDLLARSLEAA